MLRLDFGMLESSELSVVFGKRGEETAFKLFLEIIN